MLHYGTVSRFLLLVTPTGLSYGTFCNEVLDARRPGICGGQGRLLRQAGAAKTDIVFEVGLQPESWRQDEAWRCGLAALLGTWAASSD